MGGGRGHPACCYYERRKDSEWQKNHCWFDVSGLVHSIMEEAASRKLFFLLVFDQPLSHDHPITRYDEWQSRVQHCLLTGTHGELNSLSGVM